MLTENSFTCQVPVSSFLLGCKPMKLGVLSWYLTIGMQFVDTQITCICLTEDILSHARIVIFEQTEIVGASITKCSCNDFQSAQIDHYLCFLCVSLFLSTVVSTLFFFGRSIGCSVASTTTISMTVSLGCSAFLPGN